MTFSHESLVGRTVALAPLGLTRWTVGAMKWRTQTVTMRSVAHARVSYVSLRQLQRAIAEGILTVKEDGERS